MCRPFATLALLIALLLVSMHQPLVASSDTDPTERLANGGFERGLEGWSFPSWFAGSIGIQEGNAHSGTQALRFQGKGSGYYLRQDLTAAPGERVELSGWVNLPEQSGEVILSIELVARHENNGDLQTFQVGSFATNTAGWLPFNGSVLLPNRTVVARVQVRVAKLNGSAYLDDLSLKKSSDGGSTPTGTATTHPTASNTPITTVSPTISTPTATIAATSTPTNLPATATRTATATATPTATPSVVPPPNGRVLADTAWPTYGGNEFRNNRSPYIGPQSEPALKWSFNRSNDHWGTDYRGVDIGENETVYLAAGMPGVYAMDSSNGRMKWLYTPQNTGHGTSVEFPPTVSYDGKLYFTSENDYIYALTPDGKQIWSYRASYLHTPVSISPDGSTVHFTSDDGNAYALDRSSGTLKWKYEMGNGVQDTGRRIPVVYDTAGNLYFCWISTVWSLTPNGQKRWSLDVPYAGNYMVGPALADDGTMVFTYLDKLYAVSMAGQLKWSYTMSKSGVDRTAAIGGDGTVYMGAEDGFLYAINPDGTLKWKQQYVTAIGWSGGIKSNLLLDARGTLYFLGKDRYVYAVDSASRQVLWKHPTIYDNSSLPGIQLALGADGTLYAPIDKKLLIAITGSSTPPPSSTPTVTATPTRTATQLPTATATAIPSPTPTPTPTLPAARTLFGAWVGSDVNVAGDESAFDAALGKPRAVRHWYWSVSPLDRDAANFASWSASTPTGATLMLSWAPSPEDSTLEAANNGDHDGYITEWALALKAYGREVLLRMMWEDNGPWFWWYSGGSENPEMKEQYRMLFRRVVEIFRQQGANNVKFVWSPHAQEYTVSPAILSYPGDSLVDWIALDGYPLRGGAGDFRSTFQRDYDDLVAIGKPMMVAETSISLSSDQERAAYVRNLLDYELPYRFPRFEALVWFDEPHWGSLLDPAYPLTLNAFKQGIAAPYYKGR